MATDIRKQGQLHPLPIGDLLEAVKFAERTSAMYAAGADKRGHTVAATRHREDADRFARAYAALVTWDSIPVLPSPGVPEAAGTGDIGGR